MHQTLKPLKVSNNAFKIQTTQKVFFAYLSQASIQSDTIRPIAQQCIKRHLPKR